ncbi:MAG: glutathione S-transferase N-terminal domain-containing protein [Alphaproteobacteria bacterium]|jgi:GST-like protein|nr:glutathione S-transferase N-terminal domain-containing protein [Alphaproteobacteria bacterium]MDP6832227.1 glutathione S-transferase N-terminal domain-containing protein [Alphaproteobacteria bacterium]
MAPIDLYFWPTPNGWKITIMLEECDLPYNIKLVDLSKKEQFAPDFLAISPNGRMPAIVNPDGPDGNPISVFESGAILQYLGNKTGWFYPVEQRQCTEVEQWLFWQVAGLGPMAGQAAHFRNYKADKIDYAIERYTNEVIRLYGVMNTRLADRDFLAGEYSIADMACWPWIRGYKAYGIDLGDFEHLRAWFKRVGARPAVERAANIGKEQFKASQSRAQSSI